MATVWSSFVKFFLLVRVLVSVKPSHRVWLRILSTALEAELKVLEYIAVVWSLSTIFLCFSSFSLL